MEDDLLPDDTEWHLADVAQLYHKHAFADPSEQDVLDDDDPYKGEAINRRRLRVPQRKFDPRNPSVLDKLVMSVPRAQRRGQREFDPSKPIRVRVLDVDRLSIEDVHRHFMHTMVRRLPAEYCLKVASRVGQFRDKHSHQSYENLLRDCGRLFGTTYGPELLALFARCYATISVPYIVDYTRRFGQFSKQYIANLVDKTEQPRFFDFMRYDHCGGVRPTPGILKEPYALSSYTRLLAKCSAKRYMFEELQKHGHLPPSAAAAELNFDELSLEVRVKERITGADPNRPAIMDKIIAREHAKASGTTILEEVETVDPFAIQFQRVAQDPEEAADVEEPESAIEIAEAGQRWWSRRRDQFKYCGRQYALVDGAWTACAVPRKRQPYRSHRIRRDATQRAVVKREHALNVLSAQ